VRNCTVTADRARSGAGRNGRCNLPASDCQVDLVSVRGSPNATRSRRRMRRKPRHPGEKAHLEFCETPFSPGVLLVVATGTGHGPRENLRAPVLYRAAAPGPRPPPPGEHPGEAAVVRRKLRHGQRPGVALFSGRSTTWLNGFHRTTRARARSIPARSDPCPAGASLGRASGHPQIGQTLDKIPR